MRPTYNARMIVALKKERLTKQRKLSTLTQSEYQQCIGELKGAGHLKFANLKRLNKNTGPVVGKSYEYEVLFSSNKLHEGESPHLTGYLQSSSFSDKRYRVKGWINGDGTVRLEVVQ